MIEVETSIIINRPSEEVFAYISNFENNPRWQSGTVEATFTSEGPFGVGSTYTQVATFLGRRVESTFEVIAFEPGRLVKATSTGGSFPITFTRIVESINGGAKVSAIVEGDASGFYKLAEPLMRRIVQRSVDGDYAKLKNVMESSSQ